MAMHPFDISIENRKRRANPDKVKELAESMELIGLLNPVTVSTDGRLIAGFHRLLAARELGWEDIAVNVLDLDGLDLELAEIDENLRRNELTVLEQGEHLNRREQILTEKGLRAPAHRPKEKGLTVSPLQTTQDIACEIGLSEASAKRRKQIARDISPEVKEIIAETEIADSTTQLLALARMEPEKQKAVAEKITSGQAKSVVDANRLLNKESVRETPPLSGKYRVIYADPPWSYRNSGAIGADAYGRAETHYPTMPLSDICKLPVADLAEDNAVLFIWATSPLLEDAFAVINAWGFNYKSSFVWNKLKHNFGHYNSVRHELLLIATKGSCVPDHDKLIPSVIELERTEKHSEKPEYFRELIDTLYPFGNRIELFSRTAAKGWDVWGNQAAA